MMPATCASEVPLRFISKANCIHNNFRAEI